MKPLLAATIEDTAALNYPVLVSHKLDGIRALVIDGTVVSRNLKPIRNNHVQALFGKPEFNGLDGELIVGNPFAETCYRDTSSGVMSGDGEPDVYFHAFDRFDMDAPYLKRKNSMRGFAAAPGIILVEQRVCATEAQLLNIESQLLGMGAEGVMVRSPDAPYKQGRATLREGILGKLKRFSDAEFLVIGVTELEINENEQTRDNLGHAQRSTHQAGKVKADTLGALICRTQDGLTFQCGGGFTAEQRRLLWAQRDSIPGRVATIKFFAPGGYSVPRFPVFLRWAA